MLEKALDTATDALRQQDQKQEQGGMDGDHDPEVCCDGCGQDISEEEQRALRVEALGLVAKTALMAGLTGQPAPRDAPGKPRTPAPKNLLVVHVNADVLAVPREHGRSYVEGTGNVSAETSRRLGCDAQVVEVVEDEQGHVLDVGRKRRRVTEPLARALRERDSTCRFPGCSHTRHLQAHHIEHWANGGETNLKNIISTCSWHHGLVHEGGFSVEGTAEAPVFRNPRGEVMEASPSLPPAPPMPADALVVPPPV